MIQIFHVDFQRALRKHDILEQVISDKLIKNNGDIIQGSIPLFDPKSISNYLQFKTKRSSLAQFVWKWRKKMCERFLLF